MFQNRSVLLVPSRMTELTEKVDRKNRYDTKEMIMAMVEDSVINLIGSDLV